MSSHAPRLAAMALLVTGVALAAPQSARAAVEAVPTFHSMSLAWSGSGGSATVACDVRYRVAGTTPWTSGFPLWFDARAVGAGTPGARAAGEYRGSLVQLAPGTTYDVELSLRGTSTTATVTASTWSEDFPIGSTTTLPATSSDTLAITTSGSASGYALYTAPAGATATIDVAGAHDNCIYVDAAYVIVRGVTLRNAATNAIELGPNAHDVVIERNDISGWGRIDPVDGAGTSWGAASHAAVFCVNHPTVERTIVQRNRIHDPRTDSNSWAEPRPSRGGNPHPLGPQAVTYESCGGNHVFRYNDVFSSLDHYFQDGIGGGENFSFEGFPRNDSDIYGNRVSQCWDDGIESEGGNRNVRVWGNYIDETYVKVAVAGTSVGPIYVFRNVANVSRWSDATDAATVDDGERGPFLKAGSSDAAFQGGRIFVFHNTLLQPVDARYTRTLGCGGGLSDPGGPMTALVSRNNVLAIHKTWWASVSDGNASPTNDFDFDLHNGIIQAVAGAEAGGWMGSPIYDPANPTDVWALAPSSAGFDVGTALAGFNEDFRGAGPDVGAFESGAPPLEFGANAYATTPPPDGGVRTDGGSTPDAAIRSDGGAGMDAGGSPHATSGCGCRVVSARNGLDGSSLASLAFAMILLHLTGRRARRAARGLRGGD